MRVMLHVVMTVLVAGACAPPAPVDAPAPTQVPGNSDSAPPRTLEPDPAPLAPPALAAANGWMPVHTARIPEFLTEHPTFDGRGVLIAILDSGLDPSVPGLKLTSTGEVKVIDLRDLSGEGRVKLEEVTLRGDTVFAGPSRVVLGAGRLRALSVGGASYAGALLETLLGTAPAADLNGNRLVGDTLPVVVTRASDGWILLADTDGDGTLADEVAVRDYGLAQETFGWSSSGQPSPLAIAVNLEGVNGAEGPPRLDLVFDNSGHGTHVAGIAAGHDMYGIPGFDGVAPGAVLLGIKIANDARGGITVTGSILEATDYAIRSARARRQPLVINLSFGVGNEREGAARIDGLLDSVLAVNPDVVMVVSAGNDGPGLSTIGFPGSARRVVSVGATYPGVFLPPSAQGTVRPDLIAFFSSRGGELARPDLLAPGLAYSTIPRWNTGDEVKSGTSMASPYVAGLVADLLSAAQASKRSMDAAAIRHAMVRSSRLIASGTPIDQGAGVPDLPTAWNYLLESTGAQDPVIEVRTGQGDAAMVTAVGGASRPGGLVFTVTAPSQAQGEYRLTSRENHLVFPGSVTVGSGPTEIPIVIAWDSLGSEVRTSVIEARGISTLDPNASFRLMVTAGAATPIAPATVEFRIESGGLRRFLVESDSGRAFRISLTDQRGSPLLLFLHEPGGMPSREGPVAASGTDEADAVLEIDGRSARNGSYEIIALAGPAADAEAVLTVSPAPVLLSAVREGDSVTVAVHPVESPGVTGTVAIELIGAERGLSVSSGGSADLRVPFRLPAWADRLVVELEMDPTQWTLFTDFGLTLEGPSGEVVAVSPLNYAIGRLEVDIPEELRDQDVNVVLSPAFADPKTSLSWTGRVGIRLYGAEPEMPPLSKPFALESADSVSLRFEFPSLLWTLGDAFDPLGSIVVEVAGATWRTETRLGPRLPPVMR